MGSSWIVERLREILILWMCLKMWFFPCIPSKMQCHKDIWFRINILGTLLSETPKMAQMGYDGGILDILLKQNTLLLLHLQFRWRKWDWNKGGSEFEVHSSLCSSDFCWIHTYSYHRNACAIYCNHNNTCCVLFRFLLKYALDFGRCKTVLRNETIFSIHP